jgi:hypothetical protein
MPTVMKIGLYSYFKRFERSQNQGHARPDQTAAGMFRKRHSYRSAAILLVKSRLSISAASICMILIMLPFFLLAIYEKTDYLWR